MTLWTTLEIADLQIFEVKRLNEHPTTSPIMPFNTADPDHHRMDLHGIDRVYPYRHSQPIIIKSHIKLQRTNQ